MINTQPFGLCSRANYYPDCLSQVFIAEIDELFSDAIVEHRQFFEEFLGKVFRRLSGVNANEGTMAIIRRQIDDAFENGVATADANDGQTIIHSFDIYQVRSMLIPFPPIDGTPFLRISWLNCSLKCDFSIFTHSWR